jgi:hypothetical protein
VRAGVWEQHLDAVLDAGLRDGDPLDPGGLVTQGPLKVISDGSLNTLTAYCFDDYAGHQGPDAHGILNIATDHLVPLMTRARDGGLRCAIHAIGDHANALALDAFEASGAAGSVEHAQLLRAADVARFADLGVTASVQPEHAMDDRDTAEELWPGRTGRAFPLAELGAAGVRLALGSDAPVAPLDPWVAIAAAVTRSRDGREPWHPEQRIDVRAALAAAAAGPPPRPGRGGAPRPGPGGGGGRPPPPPPRGGSARSSAFATRNSSMSSMTGRRVRESMYQPGPPGIRVASGLDAGVGAEEVMRGRLSAGREPRYAPGSEFRSRRCARNRTSRWASL